jgi:signal peptidase II
MADPRAKAYLTAATVLLLDRASKWAIERWLNSLDTVRVIPGLFNLIRSENRGMVFGIMNDSPSQWRTLLLVGFSAAAVVYISILLWKPRQFERASVWGLSLILGGAAGNVLDRAVWGRVTDFLDFYVGDYHWHTFNIADSALVIGSGLLLLDLLRQGKRAANVS